MSRLEELSALELGGLVNKKKISPKEVLQYFEKRIKERNPSINAFTYLNFEDAYTEAAEMEESIMNNETIGPLAGVPIGLKDFLPEKKGWPATHGGVSSLQTVDNENGVVYKAAKKLGCIAIGKTNAPSFGFRGTTDNKMFGFTSTPFNIEYNSGGSSGGSASAVADGLVPVASCGDGGGSTRIPASWCSCFGFKASAGVVPSVCRPDAWTATHPYCCPGPVTRTVADSAVIVNEMIKYNPRDPLSVPLYIPDLLDIHKKKDVSRMRIGYTFDFDLFPYPESEVAEALEKAVKFFERYNVTVEPVHFRFNHFRGEIENAWLHGISIDSSIDFHLWKENGSYNLDEHLNDYSKEFLDWNDKAFNSNMLDYRRFHEIRTDILDAFQDVFECGYDAIISPVTGCLPTKNSAFFDTKGPSKIGNESINPLIGFGYTYLANMIGTPAASVPFELSGNNLPIGLQITAPRYKDDVVFAISGFIEQSSGWSDYYNIPYSREI